MSNDAPSNQRWILAWHIDRDREIARINIKAAK